MKFRRLYWVTEQVAEEGRSRVTGVFTSVPDLIEYGLRWVGERSSTDRFRISLVQLDAPGMPLGTWTGPKFEGLAEALKPYQTTDEISADNTQYLVESLEAFSAAQQARS